MSNGDISYREVITHSFHCVYTVTESVWERRSTCVIKAFYSPVLEETEDFLCII